MGAVQRTVEIERPVGLVWADVADPSTHVTWQPDLQEAGLLTPPPVRLGSRGFEVRQGESLIRIEYEVTTFRAPYRLTLQQTTGLGRARREFDLVPTPAGTRLTYRIVVGGVVGGLACRLMGPFMGRYLRLLKCRLESPPLVGRSR